ncbi:MAG: hypothetical protein RLZ19_1303 [Actinomycetota bacterium]|jgi:uncharacterized membrane protein
MINAQNENSGTIDQLRDSVGARFRGGKARIRDTSVWAWASILVAVFHALMVTRLQWDIHRGLGTSAYDVGLYDQGLWLLSRFDAPFVTLMGRNLFGDHASFILLGLVPVYWIVPGAETLLAVQAFVIAAGAAPFYLFARRTLGHGVYGFLFAAVWLLNPAVNGTNLENFHPDSFLGLFLPIALFAALSDRWRIYWISVVLCALVKEDVVLVMLPLGALLALRGERRRGIITAILGIGTTLFGMFIVMRGLIGVPTRNAWRIPFGGPSGFLKELFQRPTNVVKHITSEERPVYLWKMLAPLAFLSFLAPEVAMVSALVLVSNIVSTFWYQFQIEYHYSIVAVPALVFAVIVGLGRLDEGRRRAMVFTVVVASLLTARAWSYIPFRADEYPRWGQDNPAAVSAREIVDEIPADAVVSAYHSLAPHLAHREEIYMFPNPFRIVLYGPDTSTEGQRNPRADHVEYVILPIALNADEQADAETLLDDFEITMSNDHWRVFQPVETDP